MITFIKKYYKVLFNDDVEIIFLSVLSYYFIQLYVIDIMVDDVIICS